MWKYKGYELPQDAPLIIGALCGLLYYEIMIHRKPLPGILAEIRTSGDGGSSPVSSADIMTKLDKLWRACNFWMIRFLRNPGPCLRRSLLLYHWCRKNGVDSKVVVGVDKNGDELKGHAWLYVNGHIYREDPVLLAREYTVMLEG
ncbi:MAG: lasso peptide biosynthesis B2 protein [Smithella sp.]